MTASATHSCARRAAQRRNAPEQALRDGLASQGLAAKVIYSGGVDVDVLAQVCVCMCMCGGGGR
jgi:hypothetical protein